MSEFSSSNLLPTSFDVTPLLSKLKDIEGDTITQKNINTIQRVKLIELDPYTHTSSQIKTRLFLAVAYGINVVVAQLVALELGRINDNDDDNNISQEEEEEDDDELEWLDVSDERIHKSNNENESVVIYPPSLADSLPVHIGTPKTDNEEDNQGKFTSDITSCALIPSPTVQTVCTTPTNSSGNTISELIVQRTVAVMIGTSHDQVLSLLLKVTTCIEDDNVRFALEYDECKIINSGELKDDMGDKATNYPCVHQILPSSKRLGVGRNTATDHEDENNENLDKHVQIFHPALQSTSQQQSEKELSKFSGIKSITFRRDNTKSTIYGLGGAAINTVNQDIVWITYGNGTMVKLPSWRPFLAVNSNDTDVAGSNDVVDSTNNINGSTVIPFDNPFQSPLDAPPPQTNNRHGAKDNNSNTLLTQEGTTAEYWSIVSSAVSSLNRKTSQNPQQQADPKAVVLAGHSASISTPPIAFNSTRMKFDPSSSSSSAQEGSTIADTSVKEETTMSRGDQDQSNVDMALDDEQFGPVTGTVVEGTAAIVKGALKLGLGAVRWGLGSGGVNEQHFNDDDTDEFMDAEDTVSHQSTNSRKGVGSLKRGDVHDLVPLPLSGASLPFCDLPRKFETAVVDPTGSLMATTDNLGRVILFDLETNQPIRMFKGMRNVSCYFTELPCYYRHDKTSISTRLYLVIHLKQRGTVEVYRLQQGPRVAALSVPQQKDCVVIECHGPPSEGSRVGCCLLEKINEGGSHFIVDQITIHDPTVLVATSTIQHKQVKAMPPSENKQQLRILMQLLASTNIQSNAQTILTTYKSITPLADLGEGLDALSKCNRIEEEMNIDGSTLQSQAISYCKTKLDSAKKTEAHEGSGVVRKDAISSFEVTLAYHERLVNSYNILHRYETRNGLGSTRLEDEEVTLSSWASEAMSWILVASKNDLLNRRFTSSSPNVSNKDEDKPFEFYKFSTACQSKDDKVYLTKIKRSRLPILKRCFRPLLQDLFVFKVVNDMFSNLGLDQDFDVQEQYFGEWISSLSTQTIARSNIMSGTWRPMTRWLQDIILSSYDSRQEQDKKDDDVMLSSLMKYCSEMEDLPKAFLLSVICLDAVSSASMQLEQKTYGSITQVNSVRPWEELLRKLRVCLLVSFRLGGYVNPIGMSDPMTIKNVSRHDMFSVYAWVARDELSNSNDDQVIVATEVACLSSSEAFYPSTVDGDTVENKETMFKSCNNSHLLTSDDIDTFRSDSSRSLLFYMKDHARFPAHLAANRALILSSMWGKSPQSIHLLNHTISTLQILADRVEVFSLATLVEIYQSQLRPVCRAMLFGFGEHELSEEVVLPLIEDRVWLGEFITAVKLILSMIIECASKVPTTSNEYESNGMWPELRECCVLKMLVKRLRNVQLSSVELHHMVLFSYELTGSSPVQEENLFLVGSLSSEMPLPKGSPEQQELLDKAIHDKALESSSPVVDSFSIIHDILLFGKSVGISNSYVRTQYLLQMIKLGKDASINDLLGSNISSLDKEVFVERTVEIVIFRLHATIQKLKQTQNYRGVLSLLDADASRWIREVVAQTPQDEYATASLIATHSLIMRVQGMSDSLDDDDIIEKIDALCMMSGTLLKAVQSHEQESVMSL